MKRIKAMETRRDFLKKGAYVAPTVLTLTAIPSFAHNGSGRRRKYDGDSNSSSSSSS